MVNHFGKAIRITRLISLIYAELFDICGEKQWVMELAQG